MRAQRELYVLVDNGVFCDYSNQDRKCQQSRDTRQGNSGVGAVDLNKHDDCAAYRREKRQVEVENVEDCVLSMGLQRQQRGIFGLEKIVRLAGLA